MPWLCCKQISPGEPLGGKHQAAVARMFSWVADGLPIKT
jgi:hypothetical protein